jgi:hypothetical protein
MMAGAQESALPTRPHRNTLGNADTEEQSQQAEHLPRFCKNPRWGFLWWAISSGPKMKKKPRHNVSGGVGSSWKHVLANKLTEKHLQSAELSQLCNKLSERQV